MPTLTTIFYVVSTVHFGMKLYKVQRNAQVFNLFDDLLLPYIFRAFFSPSSEAGVQFFGSGSTLLGLVSAPGG
jgi:hypothetical protein